jgi:hypothetical protein
MTDVGSGMLPSPPGVGPNMLEGAPRSIQRGDTDHLMDLASHHFGTRQPRQTAVEPRRASGVDFRAGPVRPRAVAGVDNRGSNVQIHRSMRAVVLACMERVLIFAHRRRRFTFPSSPAVAYSRPVGPRVIPPANTIPVAVGTAKRLIGTVSPVTRPSRNIRSPRSAPKFRWTFVNRSM